MNVVDDKIAAMVYPELVMHRVDLRREDGFSEFAAVVAGGVVARLTSGKSLKADVVLISIGVKPNTGFIAKSGIAPGKSRHILVDNAPGPSINIFLLRETPLKYGIP